MITVVQPSLWQPTRLSQTSSLSVKNQSSIAKSEISNEHVSQLSSLDDTKDSLKRQVITLPACAVNKPTDKDDVVLTKRSQASVAEKQNKHEVPVSCIQTELTTKSSHVVHSDLHLSQSAAQPNIPTSDLKEQFANKSEYFDDNISAEETHYKHKANLKYTPESQSSSTMVSQSLRHNKDASTVTCESKEQISFTGTLPPEVYKRRHTEMAEHKSDKTSVPAVSHPLQSSSRNEPPLQEEVSYEEADENVMFEELFGSSGEEEDHNREDDDIIEGAVNDDSDIEMELGVAYHEMEQRKVEEEFKRITTHSSNVPHTSVSM